VPRDPKPACGLFRAHPHCPEGYDVSRVAGRCPGGVPRVAWDRLFTVVSGYVNVRSIVNDTVNSLVLLQPARFWSMLDTCLVHLVWAPLGVAVFRDFLDSYRRYPGGRPHQLLVLFNGFTSERETEAYYALLDGLEFAGLTLERPVQDIAAYFEAAKATDARYVCFLNSHSIVLDESWLAKLHAHATREGVGLVGATASYESHFSNYLRPWKRLRRVPLVFSLVAAAASARTRQRYGGTIDPFPNAHVRTNAFMLTRERMLGLERGPMLTKAEAYQFESGPKSMTRQLLDQGLEALVVGKDGRGYEPEAWYSSATYRSGDQRNLLVSDNRTRQFQDQPPALRAKLTHDTWGTQK
jgi:hypothetical protein